MKSKHAIRVLTLAILGTLIATPALAQDSNYFYGGLSAGQSRSKIDENRIIGTLLGSGLSTTSISSDEHDMAYKIFGGYQFNRNFALEGGYFNLGKFGFSANTIPTGTFNGQIKVQGFNLDLVGTIPVTDRFSVFARAGAQVARTRDSFSGSGAVSVFNPNPSKREVNYKAGVGLQYEVNPSFIVRGEVERYRINDAVGGRGNVDVALVTLVFPFGRSPPAPRMMPVASYVAPMPAPPPAVAPVVVVTPPPQAVVVPVPAPPVRRRVSFSAESLFTFDKAVIKPEGKTALDRFSGELAGTQFDTISVEGHADRLGTDAYNMRLSSQRAAAVKAYLIASGRIDAAKISAVGKGETMPVTKPGECKGSKPTKALIACLQPDRRVDVEVTATR